MYLLEIYVTNAALSVNRTFTYVSDTEVKKHVRVKLLFAHSSTLGIVDECTYTDRSLSEIGKEKGYKLSKIIEVIDEEPIISDELYQLSLWLSKTTVSPFISCLNCMLPKALKTSKNTSTPKMIRMIRKVKGDYAFTKKQEELYDSFETETTYSSLINRSSSITKKLIEMGALEEFETESRFINQSIKKEEFKTLSEKQKNVYETILRTDKKVSLLFGITGSGKTEVYLHLAREYLKQGKEVLILVPEISLTPQMIERVKSRFEDVIFYHSELSDQERYEQYQRVKNHEVRIVVGTRSAIFLPFKDLGIIIIDEEHDSSYKQDSMPCYHAKNVAIKRAYDQGAKVLLASATPSLDSYSRALKGDYEFTVLDERINHSLPSVSIIDITSEIKRKGSYIISSPLKAEIEETLNNKKQAIILLNRRGYSPIVKCSSCNTVLTCSDCDIPLNYHKDIGLLKCHQCSRTYKVPKYCPNCESDTLLFYGFGTKRVEEELQNLFPDARIARMDRDNVTKKGAHAKILEAFGNHETDILIGTQMIAKGLDYPDVTLVGILNADAGLLHQDYNSAKMTFDLLMQASGRSGRSDVEGKVLIQAFNSDHYALKSVLNQDYVYFYNIEMNYRKKASYPPYTHIVEIIVSDTNEERLNTSVNVLEELSQSFTYHRYRPFELPKIKKQLRTRILFMDKDLLKLLNDTHSLVNVYLSKRNLSKIKVDIDPLYLE